MCDPKKPDPFEECKKLDPEEEKAFCNEVYEGELEEWPEEY
jgi:capsid portal protein